MTRGTPAFGKRHQKTHTLCRRCDDGWGQKVRDRKGQGTGRMRYMKTIARRAKNGFRSGTQAQPKVKAASN
ncbi:hypothetical protein ABPG74_018600 [Tetrahymena malaccensis]